ncbi:MAG: hypothetical protein U9Q90_06145 [Campylobacterota bacterium]|nr:hypothetical protein [Campylobacterota bacterium]
MLKKLIFTGMMIGASALFVGCGGGGGSDSSSGSSSSGSSSGSSSSSDVKYNMCTRVSGTEAEVACTVYDCDPGFELDYSYNKKENCDAAAKYWLENVTGGSASSSGGSASGSSGWNLCGKTTDTHVHSQCTQTSCEPGYSLRANNYSSATSCENDATRWRDAIVEGSSYTPSGDSGGTSSGSSGSSSSDNGDAFVDQGHCFSVVFEEWGKKCGDKSLQVKWRNNCQETLDLRYCMERTDGTWSCGLQFDIQSGATSGSGAYICEATGKVEWRGRSSDSTASFPQDH